ncbi:hypothetical protein Pla52o_47620 [Novipirellula galeiformis]|uniref:Uncharacterized protein n=1 Tax=Novipirellula galeiformis TaxID=2528004 RepID=A0A5C6CA42_9BACT|nr:hypothetical protein Pla52o_47620 [Novipirellula galeiformis]
MMGRCSDFNQKNSVLWRIISTADVWTSGQSRTLEKIFLSISKATSSYKIRNSRQLDFWGAVCQNLGALGNRVALAVYAT